MFTVGPSSMSRPSALNSSAVARAARSTSSGFHVAPIAIPLGKLVAAIRTAALGAFVCAEGPVQFRVPSGPSAILIAGIPSRGIAADSIHDCPASSVAFSSSVIRLSRSFTRSSAGSFAFL